MLALEFNAFVRGFYH